MAGLLDSYQVDPLAQGLLGLSGALLTPRSQGGGIGAGFQAFNGGMMQAQQMQRQMQQDALRQQMLQAQIGEYGAQSDYRKSQAEALRARSEQEAQAREQAAAAASQLEQNRGAFESAYQQSGGQWSPELTVLATRAGIKGEDLERYAKGGNLGRMPLTFQGGIGRDPLTGEARVAAPDVNKPMFPSLVNGQVQAVPNTALQNFEVGKAKAGATNIGMPRIEVKMGDSIGGQVGPMLKDSATATQGAVKMADSAERILGAIDRGGVIAGPGASLRLKGAQVASMLGIGGKDAVASTRQVVRGLAEASVEARKELAGQGQVTENEAKAVDKALSGNIDDLTVDEIRDIAKLNLRHAAMRAQQHQQYLSAMPESMRSAQPFYTVPGMDRVMKMDPQRYAIQPPAGANIATDGRSASGQIGQPSVDDLLKKYGGKK